MARMMTIGMAALTLGACGLVDSGDPPSIAGRYDLVAVNATALPCCAQTDSIGTRVTFIDGNLTLGEGPPEPFTATPAGEMPGSCVHEIPNGARVDTSGVVTLPDGRQYRIPKCTDLHHAPYTMIVTRRYDYAGDSSKTVSATSSGTYAWSDGAGGQPELVALLNGNLVGSVTSSPSAVEVTVGRANFGRGAASTPSDPVYRFLRATP
jgi:hypothetical protein